MMIALAGYQADGNEMEKYFGGSATVTNAEPRFMLEEVYGLEAIWKTCHSCVFLFVPLLLVLIYFHPSLYVLYVFSFLIFLEVSTKKASLRMETVQTVSCSHSHEFPCT